jgi:signal transduction histidine kinase
LNRLEVKSGAVRRYSALDGLSGNQGETAVRDRHGALWFAGVSGVTKWVPQAEALRPTPAPRITAIRVNGSRIANSTSLRIPAEQTRLDVDYLAIDFRAPRDLLYQYKLDGPEDGWSEPSRKRTISFASLRDGRHELKIRAIRDGYYSAAAALRFEVEPPVWRQGWFVATVFALTGMLAYGLHRLTTDRLVQLERLRTHIATDLHDDIGSSLSQIALLSEVARRESGDSEALQAIGTISRELIDSIGDVVWAIDSRRDTVDDLTARMRRFAGELLGSAGTAWHLEARMGDARKLNASRRRAIFLIFKESLHNVVKHAGPCEVHIRIAIESRELRLTVADSGRGFSPDRLRADGNGLRNMRERARQVQGDMEIYSKPGGGTRVVLRIPMR